MRRFYLYRKEDATGMSGTGRVAEGCEFENGFVAWTWLSPLSSMTISPSISVVEKLHTHNGKHDTRIVWVDDMHEDVEEKAQELKQKKKELEEKLEELDEKLEEVKSDDLTETRDEKGPEGSS